MKPMLLRDYCGQPCKGWLASRKLDGWRMMWDGENFILREGGLVKAPKWFRDGMPKVALDGELFAGDGNFNAIQRLMVNGWHGLEFHVFDMPAPGPFSARLKALQGLALPAHCKVVEFHTINNAQEVWEQANAICDAGGEGIVVRNPNGKYLFGQRTWDVLRLVPQDPAKNRRRSA